MLTKEERIQEMKARLAEDERVKDISAPQKREDIINALIDCGLTEEFYWPIMNLVNLYVERRVLDALEEKQKEFDEATLQAAVDAAGEDL
jgi:sorbitol-specific phosphotransferase system component IIBC